MEILQNFWNAISTEDENLMKYLVLSLSILEIYSTLKLFTAVLNIQYTSKQRNLYFISVFVYMVISTLLIPSGFSIFFTLIILPAIVKLIFKVSILKSILAELIMLFTTLIIESIYVKLCYILFNISINNCLNIPLYRIPFMLFIYATILILSKLVMLIKFNLNTMENINKRSKKLMLLNLFFILLCIAMQFYLLLFYNNVLPMYITIVSLISLIAYAFISFYSMIKSITLEITQRDLAQSELHNKTLEVLYNNVSGFKHDFSNIVTALGGLIGSRNIEGLENYYNKILDECNINNNLSTLNPKIINNPAVYNILATKYYKADELDITINMQVFINLNELKMDIYDFCRILGILLDNSIEAASKCKEKIINIDIHDIKLRKCQIVSIENTYSNKNIDISKLSEKGYTSKTDEKESHGIGLWQVSKILRKHKNVILDTSKSEDYFKQELAIYY